MRQQVLHYWLLPLVRWGKRPKYPQRPHHQPAPAATVSTASPESAEPAPEATATPASYAGAAAAKELPTRAPRETSAPDAPLLPELIPQGMPLEVPEGVPEELAVVWQVWSMLAAEHVDRATFDPEIFTEASIRGMLVALKDPHTNYVSPDVFGIGKPRHSGTIRGHRRACIHERRRAARSSRAHRRQPGGKGRHSTWRHHPGGWMARTFKASA